MHLKSAETPKKKLFNKLREFYPDKDFVLGVISNAGSDKNCQLIIDFIDKGEDVTVENILALSILIENGATKNYRKKLR